MNTETNAMAPKGYVECLSRCGRWAYANGLTRIHCNACVRGPKAYEKRHPDWTPPPIAPPTAKEPKHIERRAGQRWRAIADKAGYEIEVFLRERASGLGWVMQDGSFWPDACWDDAFSAWTMTLISDTPETGKPWCVSCGCDNDTEGYAHLASCPNFKSPPVQEAPPPGVILQGTNDGQTWTRCASSFGCSHRQHRAVQEAPKAVPVCRLKSIGPHVCDGAVATRIMRGLPTGLYCEVAYRTREASFTQLTRRATGTPYTGPERLTKPVLARDEGVESDCWPEAGR